MAGAKAGVTTGAASSVFISNHEARLTLPRHQVLIRKNGIEFLSQRHFPLWREVVVRLQMPGLDQEFEARGVVVDCVGNRHAGYVTSVMFLGLSPKQLENLELLARM